MKDDKKPIHGSQETIIIGAGSGGAPAGIDTNIIGAGSGGAPAGITKM